MKGLSSMPIVKKLKKGVHIRPLNLRKNTLKDIVEFSELKYVYDNLIVILVTLEIILEKVIPVIENRWPSYAYTISSRLII